MAFFNGSLAAQNLQLGLDDSNLITTKVGALKLKADGEDNGKGQIEIGEMAPNIPQMTITKDGVVIESNLVVKGQQTSVSTEKLLIKDINIELGRVDNDAMFQSSAENIVSNRDRFNTYSITLNNGSTHTITDGIVDISAVLFFDNQLDAEDYVSYESDYTTFSNTKPGYNPSTQQSQSTEYTHMNWITVNTSIGGTYQWGYLQNISTNNETELNDTEVNDGGLILKTHGHGSETTYGTTGIDKSILYDKETASWKLSEHAGFMKNKRLYSIDEAQTSDNIQLKSNNYGRMFISQNASNNITTLTGRVTDITNHSITELKSYKTKVLYVDNGRTDNYSVHSQQNNTDINVLPWGSSISEVTGDSRSGQDGRNGTEMRPYKTITQAIDAATNNKYKYVIIVKNGVYTEGLNINNKDVTIQGESQDGVIVQRYSNPLGLTMSSGTPQKNSSNIFTINASGKSVILKNMTMKNGNYGIYSTAGNVTVENCKIYRNGFDGQHIGNHINTIGKMQEFRNNHMHTGQTGGGIYIRSSNRTDIRDCYVYENSVGIQLESCTSCNVINNDIYLNMKYGVHLGSPSGGSGQIGCSDCMVHGNTIENNASNGIFTEAGISNRIYNNNIYNNWNSAYLTKSSVEETLENNVIRGNNLRSYNGTGNTDIYAIGSIVIAGDKNTSGGIFGLNILRNKISDTEAGNTTTHNGIYFHSSMDGKYNTTNHVFKVNDNTLNGHDIDDNTTSKDIINASTGFTLHKYGNLLSSNSAVYNGLQCSTLALDIQNISDNNANVSLNQAITLIKRTVTGTQEITIPAGPSSFSGIYNQGIQKHIFFDNTDVPLAQRPSAITIINFTYTDNGILKKGLSNGDAGASKLKFNASGQSVTLLFVDNKWKIINSGALIIP